MEVQAVTKYVRISPQKANEVACLIRGMSASAALDALKFMPRKAARILYKTLQSAVANAENNAHLDVDDLIVKSAEVGGGPRLKRHMAVARGSAHPLLKRTSHLRIVLADNGSRKKKRATGAVQAEKAAKAAAAEGGAAATETEKAAAQAETKDEKKA